MSLKPKPDQAENFHDSGPAEDSELGFPLVVAASCSHTCRGRIYGRAGKECVCIYVCARMNARTTCTYANNGQVGEVG